MFNDFSMEKIAQGSVDYFYTTKVTQADFFYEIKKSLRLLEGLMIVLMKKEIVQTS